MTPEEALRRNGWVRDLARALVRDDARGDDVAQEAAIAAWRAAPDGSLGAAAPSPGWWRGVVRRLAALEWRREARVARRERSAASAESVPATVEVVAQFERQREVIAAVDALPAAFREALLLRFFEGLPPRAIATRLVVPVRTVESRIARGLERLRAELIGGCSERRRALHGFALAGGGAVGMKTSGTVLVAAGALLVAGASAWWIARPSALPIDRGELDRTARPGAADSATMPAAGQVAAHVEQAAPIAAPTPPTPVAPPAPAIRGHVVWRDQPFAGATVALFRREGQEGTSSDWDELAREEPIATALSGEDGSFAIAHDPAGATFLRATAPPNLRSDAIAAECGPDHVVRLRSAASLIGVVAQADDGAPVANALVSLTNVDTLRDQVATRTDAGGRYEFLGLDPGRWRARVVAAAGTAMTPRNLATTAPDSRFRVREGDALVADFALGRGAVLSGRVTDAATGLPIAGARLTLPLFAPDAEVGPSTAADGSYRWTGLRLIGLQPVAANAPGYGTAVKHLHGEPDGEICLHFALARAATVHGRVLGVDGLPIANAQLRTAATPAARAAAPPLEEAEPPDFGFNVEERSARTDAQGRYEVARLSADRVHWLRVRAAGHADALFALPELAPDRFLELPEIRMQPAAELRGTVVSATGEPLRAGLALEPPGDAVSGFRDPLPPRSPTIDAWLTSRTVTTATDGSFRFDRLGAGPHVLRLHSDEAATPPAEQSVDLSPGGTVTLPPIVLDTGLCLGGRLVTTDGSPVAGARIAVHSAPRAPTRLHEAIAAADGSFFVRGLSPGTYAVQVGTLDPYGSDESGESAVLWTRSEPIEAGRTDVVVPVEVGRWIEGRVRHSDGRATGSLAVRASWSATRAGPETRTDEWGRFRMLVPRRGPLTIAVQAHERPGNPPLAKPLVMITLDDVAAVDDRPVELLLPD
jgi:RNA polymerase sigma-70 factor (ECF subfamily)